MSAWASASAMEEEEPEEELGRVNVPWVVLSALLMGAGIFLILTWLITFDWVYFPGVGLMAVGFLLTFHPRAGLDRAE